MSLRSFLFEALILKINVLKQFRLEWLGRKGKRGWGKGRNRSVKEGQGEQARKRKPRGHQDSRSQGGCGDTTHLQWRNTTLICISLGSGCSGTTQWSLFFTAGKWLWRSHSNVMELLLLFQDRIFWQETLQQSHIRKVLNWKLTVQMTIWSALNFHPFFFYNLSTWSISFESISAFVKFFDASLNLSCVQKTLYLVLHSGAPAPGHPWLSYCPSPFLSHLSTFDLAFNIKCKHYEWYFYL